MYICLLYSIVHLCIVLTVFTCPVVDSFDCIQLFSCVQLLTDSVVRLSTVLIVFSCPVVYSC